MSFSFYVPAAEPARFAEVVAAVNEPAWRCPEPPHASRPPQGKTSSDKRDAALADWVNGFRYHPYAEGRAARGVELAWESGAYELRIITCSSRGDHELGLAIVRALMFMAHAHVSPGSREAGALSSMDLLRAYDDAWIERSMQVGPAKVVGVLQKKGGIVSIAGARRAFQCGPRFLEQLRATGSEETLNERFMRAVVALQSVDESMYRCEEPKLSVIPGLSDSELRTVATWAPGIAYLFPQVDYFALQMPAGESLYVPHADAAFVAGEAWTFMDETSALVTAIPREAWQRLLMRARDVALSPATAKDKALLELDDL